MLVADSIQRPNFCPYRPLFRQLNADLGFRDYARTIEKGGSFLHSSFFRTAGISVPCLAMGAWAALQGGW